MLRPSTELANRIARVYATLGATPQRVADFILEHPFRAAEMNIEALAEATDASPATLTRFARQLGFSSFAQFREGLVSATTIATASVEKLVRAQDAPLSRTESMRLALKDDADNLARTLECIDETRIDALFEAILSARRLCVLGTGASYHVASYLVEGFSRYLPQPVHLATARGSIEDSIRHISQLAEGDVAIAISLPRYARSTVELVRLAKSRGARVISISDRVASPIVGLADFVLLAPAHSQVLPNSPAPAFALATALIATIARSQPNSADALSNLSESLLWYLHP